MRSVLIFVGCVLLTCAVVESAPTSRPTTRNSAEKLRASQVRAEQLLAAGEYASAKAAFLDVLDIDPKNIRATHGIALASLGLGNREAASTAIDKAMTLAQASKSVDRALIINFGLIQIAAAFPMRAVKFTREYIEARPDTVDETLVNVLAVALNNANSAKQNAI